MIICKLIYNQIIMSEILLKTDKLELVDIKKVLHTMYYTLANIPTINEINEYNKINNTNYSIEKLKESVSSPIALENDLPLFDIVNSNIYLIPNTNVFEYITEKYYRIPTEKTLDYFKSKNMTTQVNSLENFNFDILFNTYLHIIYKNSNQVGKNITDCKRKSFIPFLNNSPYYSRSELINMALNNNLIKPDLTVYQNEKLDNLCVLLQDNDVSSETLIEHQLFIEKNNAQHIIYYYTFYGSMYYNKYLRNTSNIYDKYIVNNISKLNALIKKAPAFDNDVYVYRFVNSDDYLEHVRVNGIFKEESFISTSRNPFYEAKNHVFGYILLKIKLPKKKEGIALCVETYSLFPNEQEIILAPGNLKLISITDDFTYYHTDINAQQLIKKKYEFVYVEPLDSLDKIQHTKYEVENIYNLPDNFSLISTDYSEKIIEFYRSIPIINDMHYYMHKKYMFQVFYLDKGLAYQKYYYLLNRYPENQEIIFLVLQDENTQEIKLIIEISNIISVNYLHRYTGAKTIKDDELTSILNDICELFGINYAIIHPEYTKQDNTMYNTDIFNYVHKSKLRFTTVDDYIINKMNFKFLDRLKRVSPELIVKIEDTDQLYKIYKKHKFTNILNMLLYLHETYPNLVVLFINKLTIILKDNPFLNGYYIFTNNKNMVYDIKEENPQVQLNKPNNRS